jgi:hypothetical protein
VPITFSIKEKRNVFYSKKKDTYASPQNKIYPKNILFRAIKKWRNIFLQQRKIRQSPLIKENILFTSKKKILFLLTKNNLFLSKSYIFFFTKENILFTSKKKYFSS